MICVCIWSLATGIGIGPRFAMMAAMLVPLAPTISSTWSDVPGWGFLRFFRAISPAFYVLLLLISLRLVLLAWRKPVWWTGLFASASLGLLFYGTSVYFWSFAVVGVFCFAFTVEPKPRKNLLIALGTGLVIGLQHLLGSMTQARSAEMRDTLTRLDLFTVGRTPDMHVIPAFSIAFSVLVFVLITRSKLGDAGKFLVPFMGVGTALMIQNLFTNRHLQGYHWRQCLIPLWALAAAAFLQSVRRSLRTGYLVAFLLVLVGASIFTQAIMAYRGWQKLRAENPEYWALDGRMPRTLQWMNEHTPTDSVVVASPDIMDSLVLFTHNKVYWPSTLRNM